MKSWTTILGKGGTILIAIGLVLLIVSILSQIQVSGLRAGGSLSQGQTRTAFGPWHLSPLQEMEVEVTVEEGGVLKVYLLETDNEFSYLDGVN